MRVKEVAFLKTPLIRTSVKLHMSQCASSDTEPSVTRACGVLTLGDHPSDKPGHSGLLNDVNRMTKAAS